MASGHPVTVDTLVRRLEHEGLVTLTVDDWVSLAEAFPVAERHSTGLRGDLSIVRTTAGLAAVEEPAPDQRVVRLLGDQDAARHFVTDRLASYERMWDGCGCRIDYDS
jgi:hypothetical protein